MVCQFLSSSIFLYGSLVHDSVRLVLFKHWAVFCSYLKQTDWKVYVQYDGIEKDWEEVSLVRRDKLESTWEVR